MRSSYRRTEEIADEHEDLLAAIASGNAGQAEQQMQAHLEDAKRRLALILGEDREPEELHDKEAGKSSRAASGRSMPANGHISERQARARETVQSTQEANDPLTA